MSEESATHSHIWEDHFNATDAALWEWLDTTIAPVGEVRRISRSSGSVRYRITTKDLEVFSLLLRQLDADRLILTVTLSPEFFTELQPRGGGPRYFIATFFQWRKQDTDQETSEELPAVSGPHIDLPNIERPARGGRLSWPEDIKAREQLMAGEDRETVFQDWQRRVGRNKKRNQPADPRDTFRKVVVRHVKPEH